MVKDTERATSVVEFEPMKSDLRGTQFAEIAGDAVDPKKALPIPQFEKLIPTCT